MSKSWLTITCAMVMALVTGQARAIDPVQEMKDVKQRLGKMEEKYEQLAIENKVLRSHIKHQHASPDDSGIRTIGGEYFMTHEQAKKVDPPKQKPKKDPWVEVGKSLDYKSFWRNGMRMETADKAFKIHVGGRFHADAVWWSAPEQIMFGPGGVGPLEDGANFRRARIRVNGTMYEVVEWLMEYGFENRIPAFFDVYGQLPYLPYIHNLRIGHFREPFSMDAMTSGNAITFMERSLLQDAFVPFRNTGVMIHRTFFGNNVAGAIGVFRSISDNFNGGDVEDGAYSLTSRWTWNPWYDEATHGALHFGIAGSTRALPERNDAGGRDPVGENSDRFRTRPEIRVGAPFFADTGFFHAEDGKHLLGLEFALGLGPFLLQAEYICAFVDNAEVPGAPVGAPFESIFFHGYYVQTSYTLTGESRPYLRTTRNPTMPGIFGGLKPFENFFCVRADDCHDAPILCGWGAWEIGTRYSYIDLNDKGINGGMLHDLTLGLNWYLNPNCRTMLNYILIWRETAGGASDGLTQALGTRFQVDF